MKVLTYSASPVINISLLLSLRCLALSICFACIADGRAASFLNLNFEDYDATTKTLPGWDLSLPPQWGIVRINETNLWVGPPPGFSDGPLAAIQDTRLPSSDPGLEGKYALFFMIGDWSLSQRGDVPQDARFISWINGGPVRMNLRIDGMDLPVSYFYDAEFPRVHGYGQADVSAYAGKNVALEFIVGTAVPEFSAPGRRYYSIIDDIRFAPIPEPSTLGLGLFAVLSALVLCRITSKRS